MTLNEYTTLLVKILKKTKAPEGIEYPTIWDACVHNQKTNGIEFDEFHIQLFDTVFLENINLLTDEEIIGIWNSTDFGGRYESGFFGDAPKYDGDMISDIREEVIPLINLDIEFLS